MCSRRADEVADTVEAGIAEGGVAEPAVCCRIGGIDADRYAVNQTGQLRQDVASMHLVGLAVGIDANDVSPSFKFTSHLLNQTKTE